jgi:hypothetical protein
MKEYRLVLQIVNVPGDFGTNRGHAVKPVASSPKRSGTMSFKVAEDDESIAAIQMPLDYLRSSRRCRRHWGGASSTTPS